MGVTPIRLAFPLIGRGAWTGGYVYLKNTLRLIRSRLPDRIEASVFLSPREFDLHGQDLAPLVEDRLIVDRSIGTSGRGLSLASAIATGRDLKLERLLESAGFDVVFETASFYGSRFSIPVLSWIPDLQHRYMPEMFSRANWWRRDLGFRAQVRGTRTLMASSETAARDMGRFYPEAVGRMHVVPFAIELDIASQMRRIVEVRQAYGLPERFLYLPNQFWKHKNHETVIQALEQLKSNSQLDQILPIVLSGLNKDPRNPDHFEMLMNRASSSGVASHFRYLGLIPYENVLALAAGCERLINPSHFEGWSTPIEEAKALGAPLLLSDIAIHREQAPHAQFFAPDSASKLAEALLACSLEPPPAREAVDDLITIQRKRIDMHASRLLNAVQAAASTRAKPRATALTVES